MYGWHQKILLIDLSKKSFEFFKPDISVLTENIGGKGLAGHYLGPHITKEFFDPTMPLIFATGPIVDTPSPTSGRITIMSRSPLTGTICDTSAGGKFGHMLKRCGIDAVIFSGRSDKLTGIVLTEERVEFNPCPELKGLKTNEVFDRLNPPHSAAVIGPAAENGVLYANICIDRRYFSGRGGLGLVMASKGLKYFAVFGTKKTMIADMSALNIAKKQILRLVSASPAISGEYGLQKFGTAAIYDLMHNRRMMPTANFSKTYFPNAEKMNAYHFQKEFGHIKQGCSGCYIRCKGLSKNKKEMPEFETMSHFSALLNNTDKNVVFNANILCSELGLDTISMASTLACFSEVHNIQLNAGSIYQLIKKTGLNIEEGALLGQGAYRYASHFDKTHSAMCVKKLELPAYDPRGSYGMALAYITSTRGGCHLRAYPISHEILRRPVATDRFSFDGKARIIKISEDLNSIIDSLTACKFIFFAASLEEYAMVFNAVTGSDLTREKLLSLGSNIYYRERSMNSQLGFTSKDDDLPSRFFTEEGTSGLGTRVGPIDRKDFLNARSKYYKIRGLDERGMPRDKA